MTEIVCRQCGSDKDVHDELCHRCRLALRGPVSVPIPEEHDSHRRRDPDIEPPRHQPWVPRG
jgi:hypothetical protein